jgi:GT2 family glycosyltransferase
VLTEFWKTLPAPLAAALAVGSVGAQRLTALAEATSRLRAANPAEAAALSALTMDLLFAAWEDDPLNGSLARVLAAPAAPGGPAARPAPGLAPVLAAVAAAWAPPPDSRYTDRLLARCDFAKLRTHVERQAAAAPTNPYWPQFGLLLAQHDGHWDWALELTERGAGAGAIPAPLAAFLRARALLLLDRPAEAEPPLADLAPLAQAARWAAPLVLLGEVRLRLGGRDQGLAAWGAALRARPWHATLALGLADRLRGLDRDGGPRDAAPLPGPARILYYTWNKADDLHESLRSVAASMTALAPGDAALTVLDNGSTDATGEVLRAWADRFGPETFETVRLPVNVGAPAARNWLAALPSVREREFAVYLDDDAIVPPDWLRRLGAAVRAYPDAEAWGCRVVDHAAPALIQSADLHLELAGRFGTLAEDPEATLRAAFDPGRITATPFDVGDAHALVPDTGLFSYVRPCVSVTGCCHLLRTARLQPPGPGDAPGGGGFSLAFSPSQYDDLERDLRAARAGGHACYQGFLAVRHMRRSGSQASLNRAQQGNSLANKYKLHHLLGPDAVLRIAAEDEARVRRDLLERLARIDDFLTR